MLLDQMPACPDDAEPGRRPWRRKDAAASRWVDAVLERADRGGSCCRSARFLRQIRGSLAYGGYWSPGLGTMKHQVFRGAWRVAPSSLALGVVSAHCRS